MLPKVLSAERPQFQRLVLMSDVVSSCHHNASLCLFGVLLLSRATAFTAHSSSQRKPPPVPPSLRTHSYVHARVLHSPWRLELVQISCPASITPLEDSHSSRTAIQRPQILILHNQVACCMYPKFVRIEALYLHNCSDALTVRLASIRCARQQLHLGHVP